MNNFFIYFKKHYLKVLFVVVFILSIIYNVNTSLYISDLEKQIEFRDSVINNLTVSDHIIQNYFDVSYDSLSNETFYSLKREKLSTTTSIKKTVDHYADSVVTKTVFTERTAISSADDINIIKGDYSNLVGEYNKVVNQYNILVDIVNSKADSLARTKAALGLINRNFDISVDEKRTDKGVSIFLNSAKADSAFMLLSVYRNELSYDKEKKMWYVIRNRMAPLSEDDSPRR